jgi:cobyrinic acid a,c-diamide synthase
MPVLGKYKRDFKKMRPRLGFEVIYKVLGIDFSGLVKIQQIQANEKTIKDMQNNIRKAVHRSSKYNFYSNKHINSLLGFEFLNWSPKTNNDIPDNEVWIYPLGEE